MDSGHSSRKQFFSQLGLAAAGAFALPRLFGKKGTAGDAGRREQASSPLKSVRIRRPEGTVERKVL